MVVRSKSYPPSRRPASGCAPLRPNGQKRRPEVAGLRSGSRDGCGSVHAAAMPPVRGGCSPAVRCGWGAFASGRETAGMGAVGRGPSGCESARTAGIGRVASGLTSGSPHSSSASGGCGRSRGWLNGVAERGAGCETDARAAIGGRIPPSFAGKGVRGVGRRGVVGTAGDGIGIPPSFAGKGVRGLGARAPAAGRADSVVDVKR